jgi:Adenylyl/Guanylyl and SMODS C-terminal sensor domain
MRAHPLRRQFPHRPPCYHLDPDADERTLATKAGWEISDPKALYLWFKEQFDDTARTKVRRQVRYLKCWAALKWQIGKGRPTSVLLTVLTAQALALLNDDQIGGDDDTLLAVLRQIARRVRRGAKIRNPLNPSEDINRLTESEWDNFCDGIDEFVKTAEAACAANSEIDAADQWTKAFAHFFPMPDATARTILAKSAALVPVTEPEIMVNAIAANNRHLRYSGVNKIGPIPKGCDITFKLVNPHSFPAGTTIEWVVRNEGGEAENINDLGHKAEASITASERSAYVERIIWIAS